MIGFCGKDSSHLLKEKFQELINGYIAAPTTVEAVMERTLQIPFGANGCAYFRFASCEKRLLLEQAHTVSKAWDDVPVVIAGDFNCTPKSPLYDFLSKYELDISNLGRNIISGQKYSHPNFRPNPTSSDVPELARLSATILQSVTSNEVHSRNVSLTSSSILIESTTPNVRKDTSMECQSVPDEKGSTSTGSIERQSVASLKGKHAQESVGIAQHGNELATDVSDDEEMRLLQSSSSESLALADGPTISETGVNENERLAVGMS